MAGNSNSGNRTERRGKPLPVRVRLTERNAKRLAEWFSSKEDVEILINRIAQEWLDTYRPETPQE